MQDIFEAVKVNDIPQVCELIKDEANINLQDSDGCTPLVLASQSGHIELVYLLLKYGANIDLQDNEGFSPVGIAINEGHEKIAIILIKHGCNLSATRDGFSLMHAAANQGSVRIGKLLLKEGVSLEGVDKNGRRPIHWAVQEGHYRFVEWLIESGADIDIVDQFQYGDTPLLIAIGAGYYNIVKLLIDHHIDVNKCSHDGSALHRAFAWDRLRIIKLLIAAGARLNIKDDDGLYPIYYAVANGHTGLVKRYIDEYSIILSDEEWKRLLNASPMTRILLHSYEASKGK